MGKSLLLDLGITIMLLATTVMLLVFRFPSATVSVMWLISAKMFVNDKPPFRLRKFHSIANLCATMNAATTFIMFMIYGKKFRAEFTRIYFRCCSNKSKETPPNQPGQQLEKFLPNEPRNSSPYRQLPRQTTRSSSGTTTSTSIGSIPSLKRFRHPHRIPRYSLDQQCDSLRQDNLTNQRRQQQQRRQVTISEIEYHVENPSRQSIASADLDRNWLRNFIYCQ